MNDNLMTAVVTWEVFLLMPQAWPTGRNSIAAKVLTHCWLLKTGEHRSCHVINVNDPWQIKGRP